MGIYENNESILKKDIDKLLSLSFVSRSSEWENVLDYINIFNEKYSIGNKRNENMCGLIYLIKSDYEHVRGQFRRSLDDALYAKAVLSEGNSEALYFISVLSVAFLKKFRHTYDPENKALVDEIDDVFNKLTNENKKRFELQREMTVAHLMNKNIDFYKNLLEDNTFDDYFISPLSEINFRIGKIYFSQGNLNCAVEFFRLSLENSKYNFRSNNNELFNYDLFIHSLYYLSKIDMILGNTNKARKGFIKCKEMFERYSIFNGVKRTSIQIGTIEASYYNYKKSFAEFNKILLYVKANRDRVYEGRANFELGRLNIFDERYILARRHLHKAISLFEEIGYTQSADKARLYLNIINVRTNGFVDIPLKPFNNETNLNKIRFSSLCFASSGNLVYAKYGFNKIVEICDNTPPDKELNIKKQIELFKLKGKALCNNGIILFLLGKEYAALNSIRKSKELFAQGIKVYDNCLIFYKDLFKATLSYFIVNIGKRYPDFSSAIDSINELESIHKHAYRETEQGDLYNYDFRNYLRNALREISFLFPQNVVAPRWHELHSLIKNMEFMIANNCSCIKENDEIQTVNDIKEILSDILSESLPKKDLHKSDFKSNLKKNPIVLSLADAIDRMVCENDVYKVFNNVRDVADFAIRYSKKCNHDVFYPIFNKLFSIASSNNCSLVNNNNYVTELIEAEGTDKLLRIIDRRHNKPIVSFELYEDYYIMYWEIDADIRKNIIKFLYYAQEIAKIDSAYSKYIKNDIGNDDCIELLIDNDLINISLHNQELEKHISDKNCSFVKIKTDLFHLWVDMRECTLSDSFISAGIVSRFDISGLSAYALSMLYHNQIGTECLNLIKEIIHKYEKKYDDRNSIVFEMFKHEVS
jgi:tetratricopeptide (TPR) repeat protein